MAGGPGRGEDTSRDTENCPSAASKLAFIRPGDCVSGWTLAIMLDGHRGREGGGGRAETDNLVRGTEVLVQHRYSSKVARGPEHG